MCSSVITREAEDVLFLHQRVRLVSGFCVSTKVIATRREKLGKLGIFQSVYPKQSYMDYMFQLLNSSWNKGNQLNDSYSSGIRGVILN